MTIETKVKKIISEKIHGIDIEDISFEASLIEDLGADSLTIVELVMSLEDIFDIEIDDADAEKIITVQDAIDFIKSKI
jgi:acyl carrier protein